MTGTARPRARARRPRRWSPTRARARRAGDEVVAAALYESEREGVGHGASASPRDRAALGSLVGRRRRLSCLVQREAREHRLRPTRRAQRAHLRADREPDRRAGGGARGRAEREAEPARAARPPDDLPHERARAEADADPDAAARARPLRAGLAYLERELRGSRLSFNSASSRASTPLNGAPRPICAPVRARAHEGLNTRLSSSCTISMRCAA